MPLRKGGGTRVRLSISGLKTAAVLSLAAPTVLFYLTHLRWYFGLLSSAVLGAAVFFYRKGLNDERPAGLPGKADGDAFELSPGSLLFCLLAAAAWTYLSGIGGFFAQSLDFNNRNAILHDLLDHPWPVYFPETDSALTYYLGYWILPALLGKGGGLLFGPAFAWTLANLMQFLQTVWLLLLAFLLLLSYLRRGEHVAGIVLLFIFFSGMDGLICFLREEWSPHIEWWSVTWEYPSMTTSLFWVYNQAVPAWIMTLLFLHSAGDIRTYALIGLICLPYAPFPLVGMVVLCAGCFCVALVRNRNRKAVWKMVFSPENLLAVMGMIPMLLFLTSNHAVDGDPFHMEMYREYYPTLGNYLYKYVLFLGIEWGIYAAILFSRFRKDPVFLLSCASLALIPLFQMGANYNDFVMRASTPALTLLCVYCIRFLTQPSPRQRRLLSWALAAALTIGALTGATEMKRGFAEFRLNGYRSVVRDEYGSVLNAKEEVNYFLCTDVSDSFFYRVLAKQRENR